MKSINNRYQVELAIVQRPAGALLMDRHWIPHHETVNAASPDEAIELAKLAAIVAHPDAAGVAVIGWSLLLRILKDDHA